MFFQNKHCVDHIMLGAQSATKNIDSRETSTTSYCGHSSPSKCARFITSASLRIAHTVTAESQFLATTQRLAIAAFAIAGLVCKKPMLLMKSRHFKLG